MNSQKTTIEFERVSHKFGKIRRVYTCATSGEAFAFAKMFNAGQLSIGGHHYAIL